MLYLYFIENLEAVQPTEVPHLIDNDLDVLSEKALHKVATTLGDRLSDQTRYSSLSHINTNMLTSRSA
jgi:hypothetical protein